MSDSGLKTCHFGSKLHISAYFQMVASEWPDQELEATVERWKEWDLGETRHEVVDQETYC